MRSDSISASAKDQREDVLDFLIDQNQKLFAIYDARRASAETKAAGILTADVAIAALTATAVSVIKHPSLTLLLGLLLLLLVLALSVMCAVYAASGAGLRHGESSWTQELIHKLEALVLRRKPSNAEKPILSTESPKYRCAATSLDGMASNIVKSIKEDPNGTIIVRVQSLVLWQARRDDAHHVGQDKDRAAAVAGIVLGFALGVGAIMLAVITLAQPHLK